MRMKIYTLVDLGLRAEPPLVFFLRVNPRLTLRFPPTGGAAVRLRLTHLYMYAYMRMGEPRVKG